MLLVARELLDHIDRFLDAPIPDWITYNQDQLSVFGPPSAVETKFEKMVETNGEKFGKDIPENFLESFQEELNALSRWIYVNRRNDSSLSRHELRTFLVQCIFTYTKRTICLDWIQVRPCAEGLGILKVILFWISQNCTNSQSLSVCTPLSRTAPQLLKISENFKKQGTYWVLSNPADADFKIAKKVRIDNDVIVLLKEQWPTASTLNSQEMVNKRFKAKEHREQRVQDTSRNENYIEDEEVSTKVDMLDDAIERFQLGINPASPRKPRGLVIMYIDVKNDLFMHFEGRRYIYDSCHGDFRKRLYSKRWDLNSDGDLLIFKLCSNPDAIYFSMKLSDTPFYFESDTVRSTNLDTVYPEAYAGSDEVRHQFINVDRQGRSFSHKVMSFKTAGDIIFGLHTQLPETVWMNKNIENRIEFKVFPGTEKEKRFCIDTNLKLTTNSEITYSCYLNTVRNLKVQILFLLESMNADRKYIIHSVFDKFVPLEAILILQRGTREADLWPLDDRIVIYRFMQVRYHPECRRKPKPCNMYLNSKTMELYFHGPNFKLKTERGVSLTRKEIENTYWDIDSMDEIINFHQEQEEITVWPAQKIDNRFDFESLESEFPIGKLPQNIQITLDHTKYKIHDFSNDLRFIDKPITFENIKNIVRDSRLHDIAKVKDTSITFERVQWNRNNERVELNLKINSNLIYATLEDQKWKIQGQLYSGDYFYWCEHVYLKNNLGFSSEIRDEMGELDTYLENDMWPDNRGIYMIQ